MQNDWWKTIAAFWFHCNPQGTMRTTNCTGDTVTVIENYAVRRTRQWLKFVTSFFRGRSQKRGLHSSIIKSTVFTIIRAQMWTVTDDCMTTSICLSSMCTFFTVVLPTFFLNYVVEKRDLTYIPLILALINLNPIAYFLIFTTRHKELRKGIQYLFIGEHMSHMTMQSIVRGMS